MKTVIEMAREASDPDKVDPWRDGFWILTQEELERFAALVRADERENGQKWFDAVTAQRTWVGLTDEERTEIRREHFARTLPLMDAVEAKLKEKNT